ncbi:hypothetical protein N7478_002520 [Penicillium angulare]|uniref:uncharacterized protein n=1 Tax=Penicillium angulare TaxID=116970 RepID=UPI002541DC46|nr:uncharacterized protein N7478_002520 [Penicillium angulare]KAJ5286834.1 hypothetical protein N7478_002520 [Penicillium angulare]
MSSFGATHTGCHERGTTIKNLGNNQTDPSRTYKAPYVEADSIDFYSLATGSTNTDFTPDDFTPANVITREQLVNEAREIYAGLAIVEGKCTTKPGKDERRSSSTYKSPHVEADSVDIHSLASGTHSTNTDGDPDGVTPPDILTIEELIEEVRGIYSGLAMVEKKCIEIDKQQMDSESDLSPSQWEAFISLHRTLLYEYHDFFLASQHPSVSPALHQLATKYQIPARMWRYDIHSFLELARQKCPGSLEQMLSFIHIAYSMITVLLEVLPQCKETWIECLGDLARCRMAIEDDNVEPPDIFANNIAKSNRLSSRPGILSTALYERFTGYAHYKKPGPEPENTPSDNNDVRVFEIPCQLADKFTHALGDYGASRNFMREDYAIYLGLSINRDNTPKTTIGNGKQIKCVGTTTVPFKFTGEKDVHHLKFHLLPNCVHNVILGKAFLKLTKTFSNTTNFLRRVKEIIVKGTSHFNLLYLGTSKPMFEGTVNGQSQTALADSGSKVLVMDEDYARSIGLKIHAGYQDRTILTFADNSVASTVGMAYNVEWRFGRDDILSPAHLLNFHILKNAPANVILNDTLLFDTQAFSRYQPFLIDNDDYDDDFEEFEDEGMPQIYIFAIDKKEKQATSK